MAIRRRRHKHGREGRKKHRDELSAMLAPLEELKPEAVAPPPPSGASANGDYHDATIRVDSKSVKMPERLLDEDASREGLRVFRLEPLVLVITALMLVFIAFIAWQITKMPVKTEEGATASEGAGKQE